MRYQNHLRECLNVIVGKKLDGLYVSVKANGDLQCVHQYVTILPYSSG